MSALAFSAQSPSSSLEANIELSLFVHSILGDSEHITNWLDAALEYWIMRRKIPIAGWISPMGWHQVHGWQCNCFDEGSRG